MTAATAKTTDELARMSTELANSLFRCVQDAEKLEALSKDLKRTHHRTYGDKSVQADIALTALETKYESFRTHAGPFAFAPCAGKFNWKKFKALNLDRIERESDTRTLMDLFQDVTTADFEAESSFNLSEANLVKLVRLMQMMMQYQGYMLGRKERVQLALEEEQAALQSGLALIPDVGLADVRDKLAQLTAGFAQVAQSDLDAMMEKVRLDERKGAAAAAAATAGGGGGGSPAAAGQQAAAFYAGSGSSTAVPAPAPSGSLSQYVHPAVAASQRQAGQQGSETAPPQQGGLAAGGGQAAPQASVSSAAPISYPYAPGPAPTFSAASYQSGQPAPYSMMVPGTAYSGAVLPQQQSFAGAVGAFPAGGVAPQQQATMPATSSVSSVLQGVRAMYRN